METLELGFELVRRRGRLAALADLLTADQECAAVAVRHALSAAWRARDGIDSVDDLEFQLRLLLRAKLDPHGRPCPPP